MYELRDKVAILAFVIVALLGLSTVQIQYHSDGMMLGAIITGITVIALCTFFMWCVIEDVRNRCVR